jgi:general secretion pathway protein L
MAFELQNQWESWRLRLQSSGVGQFLRWWKAELVQLLPPHVQAHMQHATRRVVVQLDTGELEIGSYEGGVLQQLDVFQLEQDAQVQQQQIRDLLFERDLHEVPRDLLLPESVVLRKEVVLPLAAESNLRQALGFEMDRHTPFKVENVYFDYRVINRDREGGQVHIELLVAPKARIDELITTLAPRAMAPTGVDVLHEGLPTGLNLLPPEQRFRMSNRRSRLNLLVGLTALVLAAFVMAQSLWLREHQIDQVEEAIETVRAEARLVQGLKTQIEDASDAAGFMHKRRGDTIPTVSVLAEVTRVLPDDTFLDRLRIWEGNIQLQGKSDNAQQLIEVVNLSPLFEGAAFRGSTRLDSRSGKEIFDLNSAISMTGTDSAGEDTP